MKSKNEIVTAHQSTFEAIRKVNENGQDYWSARDFQLVLEYKEWRKFLAVIEKAKESCRNSGQKVNDHFVHMDKMVPIG